MALTVYEGLLLWSDNAHQVSVKVSTALLSVQPGLSLREMQVTVAMKLSPALLTAVQI